MSARPSRSVEDVGARLDAVEDSRHTDLRVRYCLIGVAWASLALGAVPWWIARVPLPFDQEYRAVIGLMWPTPRLGLGIVDLAFHLLDFLSFTLPFVLVAGVFVPPHLRLNPPQPLRGAYALAFILPLLSFVVSGLGRLASNLIYAAGASVSWDLTPMLTRLEGGVLASLQAGLPNELVIWTLSFVYSCVWICSLLMIVPILLAAGRSQAASHVIVGWILAAVLAIPFFLLFPVYEPWTTNPLYGYTGRASSSVRLLTAGPPAIDPTMIGTHLHWATGSCLPSLHVAMPALVSFVAYRNGSQWIAGGYALVAGITAITVVCLGRHWVVDVVAAIPFAWCIARLVARWDPNLVPAWPSVARRR